MRQPNTIDVSGYQQHKRRALLKHSSHCSMHSSSHPGQHSLFVYLVREHQTQNTGNTSGNQSGGGTIQEIACGAHACQQSLHKATVAAASARSGNGVRKADALVAHIEHSVVGAHEDIAQDPEGASGRRQVEAHEAADALRAAVRIHLGAGEAEVSDELLQLHSVKIAIQASHKA